MDTFFSILQAAFGIGFLVFVHEAGHFIAARLCRVDVLVFSLGMGPRIWGFERGGCDYRLSAIPIGGYVRMLGDLTGDPDESGAGALSRKPPLQRLFVYSAGVVMNVLVAFALFPIVYASGVSVQRPVVGAVTVGSPAWTAGIRPGSIIESINDVEIRSFDQIPPEVALSPSPLRLEIREPVLGAPGTYVPRSLLVETEYDPQQGFARIGIEPGSRVQVVRDPRLGRDVLGLEIAVGEEGAAFDAGLRTGDLLVEYDGAPVTWRTPQDIDLDLAFPESPFLARFVPGSSARARTQVDLDRVLAIESLALREIEGAPAIGVEPLAQRVRSVRPGSAWEDLGLLPGDRILTIGGAPLSRARELHKHLQAPRPLAIEIERRGLRLTLNLDGRPDQPGSAADARELAWSVELEAERPVPRVAVQPGSAGEQAGLRTGDRIVEIAGRAVGTWEDVQRAASRVQEGEPLTLRAERASEGSDGAPTTLELSVALQKRTHRRPTFSFVQDDTLLRADSTLGAIQLGLSASLKLMKQILFLLKKIVTGEVAAEKTLSGPISIASVTYRYAQAGWIPLLLLLAQLSLNLALINLLPIPALDGGSIVFVLVEAVKGSPVSDRVLGASQTVGIFLLIALMLFVTFHDVRNVFGLFR